MGVRVKRETTNRTVVVDEKVIVDYTGNYTGSGTKTFASWENENLVAALSKLFGVKDDERIGALEISNEGISCVFERGRK